MSREFEYDDDGKTSFYFVISILVLYLIPATIARFLKKKEDKPKSDGLLCVCRPCRDKQALVKQKRAKEQPFVTWSTVFFVGAWVLLIVLLYVVTTYEREQIWDPFEVLGLESSATTKEIKRRYRDLSLQYHPDKNPDDAKAAQMFMRVAKAYEALTDAVTRENWEKYGNPDGPQVTTMGIALPSWIVSKDNSGWVLGLYVVSIVIVLPILLAVWWYNSQKYFKDEVLVKTLSIFYHGVAKNTNVKKVIDLLCAAEEFEKVKFNPGDKKELPLLLQETGELPRNLKKFGINQAAAKTWVLLNAHITGVEIPEVFEDDWFYCMDYLPRLIQTLLELICQKDAEKGGGYMRAFHHTLHLHQMIIQGFPSAHTEPLLQIPHFDEKTLKYCCSKKRNIRTVQQLFALDDDTIRNEVLHALDQTQLEDILAFGRSFPYLQVSHSMRVVAGDHTDGVPAGSIVTVDVDLKRMTIDEWRAFRAETKQTEEEEQQLQLARQRESRSKGRRKGRRKQPKKPSKGATPEPEAAGATATAAAAAAAAPAQQNGDGSDSDSNSDSNDDDDDDTNSGDEGSARIGLMEDDEEWEAMQKDLEKETLDLAKDNESFPVHCPHFPLEKQEAWWIILELERNNRLIGPFPPIRVTNLRTERRVTFKLRAPLKKGVHNWGLYVISDSYLQYQIRQDFKLDVADPLPEDEVSEVEDSDEPSEDESEGLESSSEDDDDY